MNNLISFLLILFSCCTPCRAVHYYFSTTDGNDTYTATEAQDPSTPWQTLDKFNEIFPGLNPGDCVYFKRGDVFSGSMIIDNSGTATSPILISAYGEGERPVISGFYTITQWTPLGDGKYESDSIDIDDKVNMVVINDLNHRMGRFPNANAENGGYLTFESHGANFIVDQELPSAPQWTDAELVIRNERWILDRAPIIAHNADSIYFDPAELDYAPTDGFGYFIQHDEKTLDLFGEWYFNPLTKKLIVDFDDANPNEQTVKATVIGTLINLQGSHIVFDDLKITGANQFGIFNAFNTINNVKVLNCEISYSGQDCIFNATGSHFQVENCNIYAANNCGINLSNASFYSKVRNNSISNIGMHAGMGKGGDGTYMAFINQGKGLLAEYNSIINTGYTAINFGGDSSIIKHNLIDSFCLVKDDGGGIYSFLLTNDIITQGQKIIGNIVLNGIGAPEGTNAPFYRGVEGIYLDINVNNIEVIENTIAFGENAGIFILMQVIL